MLAGAPTHPVTQGAAAAPGRLRAAGQAPAWPSSTAWRWTWTRPATSTTRRCKRYCWHVAGVVGILSASIFGVTRAGDAGVRGKAGPGLPAHQHHPRRRRGCAQGPHLPAGQRAAAVRRDRGRPAQCAPQRELREADGFPGGARAESLRRGVRAAAAGRPARAAAGPDHGGDLPHAARRNRARQLPRAGPAHLAHADPQAVAGVENLCPWLSGRSRLPANRPGAPQRVAVVGGGWAGCAAAVELAARGAARSPLFEASRTLGGRARAVERRMASRSTMASTSCWALTAKRCG